MAGGVLVPVIRQAPSVIPIIAATLTKFLPRLRAIATNPITGAILLSEVIDAVQEMVGGASSPEEERGIEEVSAAIAHLLNDPNILVPEGRMGEELPLNYLTIDLKRGRAWFHPRYYSRKSVRSSSGRGFGRGRRSRGARVTGSMNV